jgi:hypothetical protein
MDLVVAAEDTATDVFKPPGESLISQNLKDSVM